MIVYVVISVYLTVECARAGECEGMIELSVMKQGPAVEVVIRTIVFRDGFKILRLSNIDILFLSFVPVD